jgi:hypothetical protein
VLQPLDKLAGRQMLDDLLFGPGCDCVGGAHV